MAYKKDESCEQKKCDGKTIYETELEAYKAGKNAEKKYGKYFRVQPQCEKCGNWHLTSATDCSIEEQKEEIYRRANKVPWDCSTEKDNKRDLENDYEMDKKFTRKHQQKENQAKPIENPTESVKPTVGSKLTISGEVDVIIDNVSIEKKFGKIGENTILSNSIKKYDLGGVINQITVNVQNNENKKKSYTILVKKGLIESNKISIKSNIELSIEGIKIMNKEFWHCNKLYK
jgi:hypothetical protein